MPEWKLRAAQRSRRNPTPSEAKLWEATRGRQLRGLRFRRQAPMFGWIADFYCPAAKLVVEVDGPYHRDRKAEDAFRDQVMREHGLTVLRFDAVRVMTDLGAVLDEIAGAVSITVLSEAA